MANSAPRRLLGGQIEEGVFQHYPEEMASSRPSQNIGMETPRLATTIVPASTPLLCLYAEMMPNGTPTITANSIAVDGKLQCHGKPLEKEVADRALKLYRVARS